MRNYSMIGILGALSSWIPENKGSLGYNFNGNSYPINNNRGHAAKQKREAKKAKRK